MNGVINLVSLWSFTIIGNPTLHHLAIEKLVSAYVHRVDKYSLYRQAEVILILTNRNSQRGRFLF